MPTTQQNIIVIIFTVLPFEHNINSVLLKSAVSEITRYLFEKKYSVKRGKKNIFLFPNSMDFSHVFKLRKQLFLVF